MAINDMSSGPLSRRSLLAGLVSGAGITVLGGTSAQAASRPDGLRPRVLIATNEPWGTYHTAPLLPQARRQGWDVVQLVPDRSQIKPDDPVPVVTPEEVSRADLLVVTGAGDWPADCAARLRLLPLVASSLAYQLPREAPRAEEFRDRLRAITASSPAEAKVFDDYLGTRRAISVVGTPQTDALPRHRPEAGTVLVLTSVTKSGQTGGSAPGTELLLATAERLAAAGGTSWSACTRARTARCGRGTRSARSRRSRRRRAPRSPSASPGPSSPSWRRWACRSWAAPTPRCRSPATC